MPRAGRLGRPARAPALAGRLGAPPPHRLERRAQRAAAPAGLSGQRRGLADLAADVQRRRRQHDPLERSLPAVPPVGLPGAQPRRSGRRLAHRLRHAGAVLRSERPHDGRGRHRPAIPPIRRSRHGRRRRSRSTRWGPPWPGASIASAGTGGRRTAPSSRATTTAAGPASTAAPATSAARPGRRPAPTSPTGPRRWRPGRASRRAPACGRSRSARTGGSTGRSTTIARDGCASRRRARSSWPPTGSARRGSC